MKKIIIIFLILVSVNLIFAQSNYRLGFNAGATYSNLRGNDKAKDLNGGIDFLVGINSEYKIKDKLSLIANLSYERKSVNEKGYIEIRDNAFDIPTVANVKIVLSYQYLNLPILLKYKFGNNETFYINGGPFLSYLLKAQARENYYNSKNDITENHKKIDFGISFGIGKTFKLKNNKEISVEVRDNLGLTNISALSVVDDGTIKTNSINLIGIYSFDLK